MLILNNTIIDDDILTEHFCCDLKKCYGACCVDGDAGAPLEEEEISLIEDHLSEIYPFMTNEGIETIKENGVFDFDATGAFVTPLIKDAACAFIYYEEGIARCAIEKAFNEGKIPFSKPISCHLYPIRLVKKGNFIQLTSHRWAICRDAREKGKNEGVSLISFLKEALERKFGKEWYSELLKLQKKKVR